MKIFYDVDTQNDFMNKDGALYVPDAELIKPNLKLLSEYAAKNKIQVIASIDNHYGTEIFKDVEGELARWGGPFPDHCMEGTFGQKKIAETDPALTNAILIEKQHYDVFTNLAIEPMLQVMDVKKAIVYGVATDFCVKAAVLGMQDRGIQCYVVVDAIKGVFTDKTKSALEEMMNARAMLVTTKQVLEEKLQ
jgi:nicotinamidase/pyrazinamidase